MEFHYAGIVLLFGAVILGCESDKDNGVTPDPDQGNNIADLGEFPGFITPVDDYFDISIGGHPTIDSGTYELRIFGAVSEPAIFTLADLNGLEMLEDTVTIECMGNPSNGSLMGTAIWKGFRISDLLAEVGVSEWATVVRYRSADGYHTYNSLEEVESGEVIGALYMNGEPLRRKYGFPLRVIFPGYYGVRQPGWIVSMEVMEVLEEDYWSLSGWHTDSAMSVDSKIFFPANYSKVKTGDSIRIGGAAFGAKKIASVDITLDNGLTWLPAERYHRTGQEHVWVFWEVTVSPKEAGDLTVKSRARAEDGTPQPRDDNDYADGTNSWPSIVIVVED